jgi:hypothetical protein
MSHHRSSRRVLQYRGGCGASAREVIPSEYEPAVQSTAELPLSPSLSLLEKLTTIGLSHCALRQTPAHCRECVTAAQSPASNSCPCDLILTSTVGNAAPLGHPLFAYLRSANCRATIVVLAEESKLSLVNESCNISLVNIGALSDRLSDRSGIAAFALPPLFGSVPIRF